MAISCACMRKSVNDDSLLGTDLQKYCSVEVYCQLTVKTIFKIKLVYTVCMKTPLSTLIETMRFLD